jgi:flagellar L-ring protein FlgH
MAGNPLVQPSMPYSATCPCVVTKSRYRSKARLELIPASVIAATLACVLLLAAPARAQLSMFSDPKANQVGDVITVILAERTAAQRESRWQDRSDARTGGAADVGGDGTLRGRFALDARFNREAQSRNESVQSDLLRGTLTAVVVGRDSTGNLLIRGERTLNVNGEAHLMRLSGIIRPFDIRNDNSLFSYQIANANIEYRRAGLVRRFIRPGAIARVGLIAVLGAAAYFATQ